MTDADLVRWLQRQTQLPVGLVPLAAVRAGAAAIRDALAGSEARLLLIDAACDGDLAAIAEAVVDDPLVTGGSGLAAPLARLWHERHELSGATAWSSTMPEASGTLVLAGSCSAATRAQLEQWERCGQRILRVATPGEIASRYNEVLSEIAAGRVAAVALSAAPGTGGGRRPSV